MPSEFAPGWSNPRMTKAQMRKYLRDMKAAQEEAKKKLPDKWHEEKEKHSEMKKLEDQFDDIF